VSKLPVLMYHNVSPDAISSHGLTISTEKFEEQLQYLKQKNYTTFFVSELEQMEKYPRKSVVLTFDDVTVNQLEHAVPLLKKYNFKATFFVPFSYIGKSDLWNDGTEKIMTIEQLKSLDDDVVELGHHSFHHRKYSTLSAQEIQEDLDESFAVIAQNGLKVYPAIAYPYGNYPKKSPEKDTFFSILEKNGIKMGFRIGNRVNRFPFKNKFKMQRIDVKGEENLLRFRLKLRIGKLKLF
jgi:peptidoglycan/xylan/chitin deacetylase (PgdA/CDA1 family)